jgi:putative tricarboxylic transport membrane protein
MSDTPAIAPGKPPGEASGDAPPGTRRPSQADFVAGLVIGLVALAALIESIRMPFYEEGRRGLLSAPGLTPGLLSLGLIVMSLLLMFRARGFKPTLPRMHLSEEGARVLGVIAILVAYVAAIKPLGYVASTFIMMALFQGVFMARRTVSTLLLWSVGLSALVTGILYYAFANVFLIPLP